MTREQIKALIDSDVNTNGTEAITGAILNNVLTKLLDFSQDEPFVFRNNSGSNIAKGDIVEISGYDAVNSIIEVEKLEVTTVKSNFFIALENVLNATDGSFAKTGLITGLSGLDAFTIGNKLYWDIATGTYTATASPSNLFVGVLVNNVSPNGSIEVQLNQNPRLYGNGTANKLAKWNDSETLTDSIIQDDGINIGINIGIDSFSKLSIAAGNGQKTTINSRNINGSYAGTRYGIHQVVDGGQANIGGAFIVSGVDNIENQGIWALATNDGIPTTATMIGGRFGAYDSTAGNFAIQLQDGTEGINKVLISVTADGKCNFSSVKTVNGNSILGSGNISTTQTLAQTLALGNTTNSSNIVFNGSDAQATFAEPTVDFPYLQITGYSSNPLFQFQGLKYAADYSANFVDESLVTKRYVDSKSDTNIGNTNLTTTISGTRKLIFGFSSSAFSVRHFGDTHDALGITGDSWVFRNKANNAYTYFDGVNGWEKSANSGSHKISVTLGATATEFYNGSLVVIKKTTNNAHVLYDNGNFQLEDTTGILQTSGKNGLSLKNAIAPSTGTADRFTMYAKDIVAGNSAPHFMLENGDIVKLYKQNLSTNPTNSEIATFLANLGLANLI